MAKPVAELAVRIPGGCRHQCSPLVARWKVWMDRGWALNEKRQGSRAGHGAHTIHTHTHTHTHDSSRTSMTTIHAEVARDVGLLGPAGSAVVTL